MDAWIDQYRSELDKSVRVDLAHKMEQKLYDSGAQIPTFKVPYTREAYWRWIRLPKGYATKTSGEVIDAMGSGLFWIDVDEKNRIRALRRDGGSMPPSTIVDETWK
jgi:microcin C transport system substrate-binding protein